MTLRVLAGTLSSRVKIATTQVVAVGALSMGFQRMLEMVCSKYLPGGLHDCEGAAISVAALVHSELRLTERAGLKSSL